MQPNNLAKEVRKLLPGTDRTGRGGCGFATCDECAAAIAEGGPANLCPACKEEDIAAIVALTGGELRPRQAGNRVYQMFRLRGREVQTEGIRLL